jgi:glycosyltransferase involved in cell wall biosynthesis
MGKRTEATNILLVANYDSGVGYAWWLMENFWSHISRNFEKFQINSILIYPTITTIPDTITESSINIIEHDFSRKGVRSLLDLLGIIRKNRIAYVYLTDRPYYDWLYLFMRMAGVKKIVNHDHKPGERSRVPIHKKCIKKAADRLGLFSCDHYIAVSNFVKKRAIETGCIANKKCSRVYNGIEVFDNHRSRYAHGKFHIPRKGRIVVTTGRATFYKGIDILIRCAHVLLHERSVRNLFFLHVGEGPDLHIFKEMAVELNVQGNFIFAGYRKDLDKILPSCEIGIQVSQGEAFSLAILEYLCAGLATLAPNSCANSEAIRHGVNGFLYTPGCIPEIVEKIEFLLADKEFSDKIRAEARRTVLDNFTIEKCDRELLSSLQRQFLPNLQQSDGGAIHPK